MNARKILDNFYKLFTSFETKDGSNNFAPENTNFNLFEWIDLLKEMLFKNDFEFANEIMKKTKDTPYKEFYYSWKYIKKEIILNKTHLNNSSSVNPTDPDFYELQNLFTFTFSQLNRLTMLHYIYDNMDYFSKEITDSVDNNINSSELSEIMRNKLKRVTFNNWRYNKKIVEYERNILWLEFLKESRNVIEHYGVIFKVGSLDRFNAIEFNFYIEIILTIFLFLYYLNNYIDDYNTL